MMVGVVENYCGMQNTTCPKVVYNQRQMQIGTCPKVSEFTVVASQESRHYYVPQNGSLWIQFCSHKI